MTVAFRASRSTTTSTGSTHAFTFPVGTAAGDFLMVNVALGATSTTINVPAGWTRFREASPVFQMNVSSFWKVLSAGDISTGSVTFSHTAGTAKTWYTDGTAFSGSFAAANVIAVQGNLTPQHASAAADSSSAGVSVTTSRTGMALHLIRGYNVTSAVWNNPTGLAGSTLLEGGGWSLSASLGYEAHGGGATTARGGRWYGYGGGNEVKGEVDSFVIAENFAPNTPTSLSPSGAQGLNAVTLSAVVTDPDGGSVSAEFQVATDAGFTTGIQNLTGSTVTSGGTSTYAFTGAANTTYYLRARGVDPYSAVSAYTAGQSFITNRPPAAVVVTSPNGAEVVNTTHAITWTGGTDPDGQATTVDIELSTNGGTTWSVVVAATPNDGSHTYDFTAEAASTACKVRIRAKDTQGVYGAYDESNANFTIAHNVAPSAPTLLSPSNSSAVDLAAGYGFDWTKNDADAGDTQTAFYLRRKIAGAGSYEYWNATTAAWQGTEIKNPRTTDDYTFVAGKWSNGLTYNWSVATEDAAGLKGPYATDFTVVSSAGATVSVTTPLSPVTDTSKPIVTWTLSDPESDPQQSYQVSVFTVAQTAVGGFDPASSPNTWGTGEVADVTARNRQVLVDLANGTTYRAYVRCKTNAQYSAWVYREFSLSLTPPASPTLAVTYNESLNRMELVLDGQHNTTSFPDVYYVAEFSDDGGATWGTVRDAGNLNGDTAQVQVVYDYEAPAWAERLYRARSVANL